MCQTSAFVEKDGSEEMLLENVTLLEVLDNGLRIATLFEGARITSYNVCYTKLLR